MNKRKKKVKIGDKVYIVGEPTVFMYELSFDDIDQFLEELFFEFNKERPEIDNEQVILLIKDLFEIKDDIFKNILDKNKEIKDLGLKDFHIVIGQFMKFFAISYDDVINMPFRVFQLILKDLKIISGEQKYEEKNNSSNDSNGPDKEKLKKLFFKQ